MVWAKNKILIAIFLFGFFLRVYKLQQFPFALDGDEAAFGYYGYSLLQNLSDEYGNKLPLYFPSIGDYKYPVMAYLSTIPVAIFGLSEFSTRFISAILGSLLVFVIYGIVWLLTKNKTLSLLTSFWVAISPYLIIFSRGAYESNVALFFLSLGILLLLIYFQRSKSKFVISAGFSFLLAIYSYSAARLFLIIFLPLFVLFCFKQIKTKKPIFLISMALVIVVAIFSFMDARSRVRAESISIINDSQTTLYVEDSIHEDGLAYKGEVGNVTRLFHNKLTASSLNFLNRYFEHFSPTYLFVEGNPSLVKYSVNNVGIFYFLDAIFIIVGLANYKKIFKKFEWSIPLWIVIAIIPSALSIETPNPIRSLIVAPPLLILISAGVYEIWQSKFFRSIFAKFIFVCLILLQLIYFWHQYSVHDYYHQPWHTDGGVKEMVMAVNNYKSNYKNVVIPDDPYIFFLLYGQVHPDYFVANSSVETELLGKWERVNGFENIIFKSPFDCPKIGKLNVLYVCKGEEVPLNSKVLDVIRFPDGKPAFILVEFVPYSQRPSSTLPDRVHYMVETDLSFEEGLIPEDETRLW